MNILLIIIGGIYNYGCEAIIRGTVALLQSKLPQEASVFYASLDFERDKKNSSDLNIQIVDVRLKKYTIRWFYKQYCLRLNEIDCARLVDRINEIQNNADEISAYLKDRLNIWKAESIVAADELIKIMA